MDLFDVVIAVVIAAVVAGFGYIIYASFTEERKDRVECTARGGVPVFVRGQGIICLDRGAFK